MLARSFAIVVFTLLFPFSKSKGEGADNTPASSTQIKRVWLTYRGADPSKIVLNWESPTPSIGKVLFGPSNGDVREIQEGGKETLLHHVEVDVSKKDTVYQYDIPGPGGRQTGHFKSCPSTVFRAVVVGDLHANITALAAAILKDDPHLILTAGDNVPSLHEPGREGTQIFGALIDSAPGLFRTIPFLPILGNHDKEAHPRGPKPPPEPVYDIGAKAFHDFFPTPGNGWCWTFDLPDFDARFVALDLQHISDFGTTWQTCHAFAAGSDQFEWYRRIMADSHPGFVFTIDNERNSSMRAQAQGQWGKMFRSGSALITGFGTFNERAEWDGFPCFNTHAHGHGTIYKDPNSAFLTEEGAYLLLTFRKGEPKMTVQIKNQKGDVLDTREIEKPKH